MGWSGWAAFAVVVIVNIVLVAKAWGYLTGQLKIQIEAIVDEQKRHDKRLEKLELHVENMDMHWTSRERGALVKELEDLAKNTERTEGLLRESLTERANIVKVVTALMDRTNNKPEQKS